MSGVVIGVPGAVRVAQAYIDAGDLAEALVALRTALLGVTLQPKEPDPDLADASRLYAGVLASLGEPHSATPFSSYAHEAAKLMDEPTSSRALQADLIHSFVLRVTGQMAEAVGLYRDVVQRLGLRFGPEGRPALAGQADLAVALHAAGDCTEARQTLHRTYFTHRDVFGSSDPQGIQMLARLGMMTRDCGGFERAHQYFDTAKALCATHLPPTDPLARQVTALARAGSDDAHVCGEPASAKSQRGVDVRDLFVGTFEMVVAVAPPPEKPSVTGAGPTAGGPPPGAKRLPRRVRPDWVGTAPDVAFHGYGVPYPSDEPPREWPPEEAEPVGWAPEEPVTAQQPQAAPPAGPPGGAGWAPDQEQTVTATPTPARRPFVVSAVEVPIDAWPPNRAQEEPDPGPERAPRPAPPEERPAREAQAAAMPPDAPVFRPAPPRRPDDRRQGAAGHQPGRQPGGPRQPSGVRHHAGGRAPGEQRPTVAPRRPASPARPADGPPRSTTPPRGPVPPRNTAPPPRPAEPSTEAWAPEATRIPVPPQALHPLTDRPPADRPAPPPAPAVPEGMSMLDLPDRIARGRRRLDALARARDRAAVLTGQRSEAGGPVDARSPELDEHYANPSRPYVPDYGVRARHRDDSTAEQAGYGAGGPGVEARGSGYDGAGYDGAGYDGSGYDGLGEGGSGGRDDFGGAYGRDRVGERYGTLDSDDSKDGDDAVPVVDRPATSGPWAPPPRRGGPARHARGTSPSAAEASTAGPWSPIPAVPTADHYPAPAGPPGTLDPAARRTGPAWPSPPPDVDASTSMGPVAGPAAPGGLDPAARRSGPAWPTSPPEIDAAGSMAPVGPPTSGTLDPARRSGPARPPAPAEVDGSTRMVPTAGPPKSGSHDPAARRSGPTWPTSPPEVEAATRVPAPDGAAGPWPSANIEPAADDTDPYGSRLAPVDGLPRRRPGATQSAFEDRVSGGSARRTPAAHGAPPGAPTEPVTRWTVANRAERVAAPAPPEPTYAPAARWTIADPVRPTRTERPAPPPLEPAGGPVRWTIANPAEPVPAPRRPAEDPAPGARWTIADPAPPSADPPAPAPPPVPAASARWASTVTPPAAAPAGARDRGAAPRRTDESTGDGPGAAPRRVAGLKPPSDLPPGAYPTAPPPPDPAASRAEPPRDRKAGAPRATFGRMRRNKGRSPEYPS